MIRITALFVLAFLLLFNPAIAADDTSAVSSAASVTNRAPLSLTTLFASNNGYAGNMFDILPETTISAITAIDVNHTEAGESLEIQVFYKMDTCVGFDMDPYAWDLLGTFTGTSAGQDNPSYIDMAGNGMVWEAGAVYGIYVHLANYPSLTGYLGYTNATSPQTYSNDDLSATCYFGKSDQAFGQTFDYRIWNGTIHYGCGPPPPLTVFPKEVSSWYGGSAHFKLNGGADLAGRTYGLFGTSSGTLPGTPLPGGLVLPVNWDWFTEMALSLAMLGSPVTEDFIGTLDADGYAECTLWLPGHALLFGSLPTDFAWCTASPFDFASNSVELLIIGAPHG